MTPDFSRDRTMLDRISIVGIAFALCFPSNGSAQTLGIPEPAPTARELYVGCYLATERDDVLQNSFGKIRRYSASRCEGYAIEAIVYREGRSGAKDNKYRFCLPKTAQASQSPVIAMAYAYVDYYEATASRTPTMDGVTAYLTAMIVKWPCEP